jgi:hypothetical protein
MTEESMGKDLKQENEDTRASRPKNKYGLTGTRLGMRGVMATALLESGMSIPKVRQATGISQTTAVFLKREKVIPREQVERVKRHLQDKFAMIAAQALESIDQDKLKQAGFGELVRGAALAAERAGIGNVGIHEQYHAVMMKYTIAGPIVPEDGTKTIEPPVQSKGHDPET